MPKTILYELRLNGSLVFEPTTNRAEAIDSLRDHLDAFPEDAPDLEFAGIEIGTLTRDVLFQLSGTELVEFVQDQEPPDEDWDDDDDYDAYDEWDNGD
jgi:hypothetical protein